MHAKKSKSGTQNRPQVHAIACRRRNFHENRKIDPEIIDVVKDVIDVIDDFTRFGKNYKKKALEFQCISMKAVEIRSQN